MGTKLLTSFQFDDPELLVNELREGVGDAHATLGFLLCDSQIEYGEVVSGLQAKVDFPIVGGTSLTFPISDEDAGEISASLMLIARDDMRYAVSVSEKLDEAGCREQMKDVYDRAAEKLGEQPRVIIPLFPLMPGFPTGLFIAELFKLAGDIPVFGGTTTGDLISTHAAVFAEGEAFTDHMVLLMLGGDIRPVFSACNAVTRMAEYAPTVTQSKENIVSRVDDMTFCEYMRTLGLSPEDRVHGVDALLQYGPIPVELSLRDRPEDGVSEISCISYTNLQEGSVAFSRSVPEGSRVSVSILHKEDVEKSARECLDRLKAEIEDGEKDGYRYDTLLCVSCVARYFVLVGGENRERALLGSEVPASLAAGGFYGFCEIGPTKNKEDGSTINRAHSASIVMCAL